MRRAKQSLLPLVSTLGVLGLGATAAAESPASAPAMVEVGPGRWRPLYAGPDAPAEPVGRFLLDTRPVTNAEFLAFVRRAPAWRRDRVGALFADASYLSHWESPLVLGSAAPAAAPVTAVSWFAARAYCAARGARLPTEAEWEVAALASERAPDASADPEFRSRILASCTQPADPLRAAGTGAANYWGVRDLHGLVWEWVFDFNNDVVSADSRGEKDDRASRFCGAGAADARDREDYARFMRAALRSSLEARYTTRTLGFRCARDAGAHAAHHPSLSALAPRQGASVYDLRASFIDQNGAAARLDVFAGAPVVIGMVYASCTSVCPVIVETIRRLEGTLDPAARARLRVVLVTLDPARDTPAALRALGERHGVDPARWRFLNAPEPAVREVAAVLGVRYRREPDGEILHSPVVALLDERGEVRARLTELWGPLDEITSVLHALAGRAHDQPSSRPSKR